MRIENMMLYMMGILFFNILIYIKVDKYKYFIVILFDIIFAIMIATTNCADYGEYEWIYSYASQISNMDGLFESRYYSMGNIEPGYLLSNKIAYELGMLFFEFRYVLYCACLFIIFLSVHKHCKNIFWVMLLYMIYPMLIDVIQIRNFVADVILLFALGILHSSAINKMKYILLIVIGMTFHAISFAYIFILPVYQFIDKLSKKIIWIVFIIMLLTGYIFMNQDNLREVMLLAAIAFERGSTYFGDSIGIRQCFSNIIMLALVIVSYLANYVKKINSDFSKSVHALNMLMFFVSPLFLLDSETSRLVRACLLPNYILWAMCIEKISKFSSRLCIYSIFTLLVVGYMCMNFLFGVGLEQIPIIINNNEIINLLLF